MIISFAGHSIINSSKMLKEAVKEQIRNNISDTEKVIFYLGGYGDFDEICAYACKELRQEYTNMETVYVTPYLSLSAQEKIKEMQKCGLYDITIYPPIENVPKKFAILRRNKWMIENSDLVITYVKHTYGGAYKSLKIAKQKKKKTINIYDLIKKDNGGE